MSELLHRSWDATQKFAHLKNRPMPDHIADMRRRR